MKVPQAGGTSGLLRVKEPRRTFEASRPDSAAGIALDSATACRAIASEASRGLGSPNCCAAKIGHGLPMVAANIKTLPAVGDGPDQNGLPGTVVILRVRLWGFGLPIALDRNQIKGGSGEVGDPATFLVGDIAGH